MRRYPLRPFSCARRETGKACLFITLMPFSVQSASPWQVSDGKEREVTASYHSQEKRDHPLYVSGEGSTLTVNAPLAFTVAADATAAAKVADNGTLILNGATLETNGTLSHGISVASGQLKNG
ncbi:hypothetical protein HA44_00540 [Mixta gaviniae]|nr:hypothetical protein HA44_00540 [Mixta gaviniae]